MVSAVSKEQAKTTPTTNALPSIVDAEDRVAATAAALEAIDKRIADYKDAFKAYDKVLVKRIYVAMEASKLQEELNKSAASKNVKSTAKASTAKAAPKTAAKGVAKTNAKSAASRK